MKKIKKLIITAVAGITIINAFSVPASASSVAYSNIDDGCVPYADVIETRWRFHYGVLQYRRWNRTRNYWVDPEWIDYKYNG